MPTNTIVVNIELRKSFQRAIQEEVAERHVSEMLKATSTTKWKLELATKSEESTEWYQAHGQYPTSVSIFMRLTGPNSTSMDIEKNDRLVALSESAMGTKNQKRNWTIFEVDGEPWKPMSAKAKIELQGQRSDNASMVSYADVEMPSQDMIDYV